MRRLIPPVALALLIVAALWSWPVDRAPAPEAATEPEPAIPHDSASEVTLPAVRDTAEPPASAAAADASPGPGALLAAADPSLTLGIPADMIAGDYPPYLGTVASSWFPPRSENGCKSPSALLTDMAEESRDLPWAPRMERELRALLEPHPLGFAVSVGCRATICQITAIGPQATALEHPIEVQRFWGLFARRLRVSPIAREFATKRSFGGAAPMGTLQSIDGIVLTSVGQASPDEPPDCAPFAPAQGPAPWGDDPARSTAPSPRIIPHRRSNDHDANRGDPMMSRPGRLVTRLRCGCRQDLGPDSPARALGVE